MATPNELTAMRRAIAISAQGLGTTSPNPPVGCVILDRDGVPVGEGYHLRKGDHHAEVNALTAAGERAEGGTAVVTLEPCNHHGRTPPCRQALIEAKVSRVLMAVMDPTSRGEGGAVVLEEAGIEVERGVLEQEALLILGPWLHSLRTGRPHITWAYTVGAEEDHGHQGVKELRRTHDLVIRRNGAIEEGVPGGHGAGAFRVPDRLLGDEPAKAVADLAESGARSVLVEGSRNEAARLLADLVDRVIVEVPSTPPSSASTPADELVPRGFRLVDATVLGLCVRLTAHRVVSRDH
ncbi:bifunctional diaminohydroxyphosphoribosylaminopyrimidine deaminase/5-amino-6-(5-phosphoribosylamino)uracil reductase RibD [Streptomyces sp. SID8382]|uniref:bifunctional diaminohydroxyphosphoribosylaminopyrimidine deaminase/5-amino-6-(5-phosphoribosylamino)uracil reductase RibD n=1 Tax=Streptomyces malaysiensis TaxID=92644 RepID=UPI000C2C8922|nr:MULTISPECIES: bifunctional diaminohydroxyphosphoribosylaminopyrimidine deaminase/5-amino-6-(5-phosphoribosylamino)uracil reductase RibD [unclassified Streptomyces]AUA12706.1 Riboflavin biosynthesis protein RibD [Streptomyces sp. M56]MYX56469.1 bifunctional diaminohydroxyphosphoribosylaminopyrimidine deaminase/5-amino-6-(5-phosphoribosylamino)uracil reductase RibD [Streptomyces sp. SID8382]